MINKKLLMAFFLLMTVMFNGYTLWAEEKQEQAIYRLGIGDVLNISVLQPQEMTVTVTIAPDGTINFPYIGSLSVQGKTLIEVQDVVQAKLGDGYMRYPVVSVSLQESNSRKFIVYGEIEKPGTYVLDNKITVLKAVSIAGGLTKFGSSNSVKILREKKNEPGYTMIKVNLNDILKGSSSADILINPGDIIVVSEGAF